MVDLGLTVLSLKRSLKSSKNAVTHCSKIGLIKTRQETSWQQNTGGKYGNEIEIVVTPHFTHVFMGLQLL